MPSWDYEALQSRFTNMAKFLLREESVQARERRNPSELQRLEWKAYHTSCEETTSSLVPLCLALLGLYFLITISCLPEGGMELDTLDNETHVYFSKRKKSGNLIV